jgi:hypothetical protein
MRGSLGEKIGEGVMADVHAWAPGQVVKLFKAGISRRFARHEARMTRAAFAAGASAPEVFDEVVVEGRFGIVLTRLDGSTLLHLLRTGAITSEQVGSILATLYISVHKTPPPPVVISLRDKFEYGYRHSGLLPKHIATGILTLIKRLPPADRLCYNDLHPGNVIMTADGPRIIDWLGMVRADAALDLGRCHLHLSELIYSPEGIDPERQRAQCDSAVRVCAAGRHLRSDADGGDGAISAHSPRLRPRRPSDQPCQAGAADAERRSNVALGGLVLRKFQIPLAFELAAERGF